MFKSVKYILYFRIKVNIKVSKTKNNLEDSEHGNGKFLGRRYDERLS